MAFAVVGNFGNVVLRSGDFNVPYSTVEAIRPERAWSRNLPVYVNSLDFIKLLQTSPIFQVDDGAGMTRRAEIHAVKYNSNLRHSRIFDVTNVQPGHRGYAMQQTHSPEGQNRRVARAPHVPEGSWRETRRVSKKADQGPVQQKQGLAPADSCGGMGRAGKHRCTAYSERRLKFTQT